MSTKTYRAQLKSLSPYSQSRKYDEPKLSKELAADYEKRTWRHRMHVRDGNVYIPPMALKNCLSEAAKFLSIQVPGKGKATYTKHVEAGVMVVDPLDLGIEAANVPGESLFVPADGRRGSGKRVTKIFPFIEHWEAEAIITVIDQTITFDVLREHLEEGGRLIGMGRFRPRNNGYYGRFKLIDIVHVD